MRQQQKKVLSLCVALLSDKRKGNVALRKQWQIGQGIAELLSQVNISDHRKVYYSLYIAQKPAEGASLEPQQLRQFHRFYQSFPQWDCAEAELSWSHYQRLFRLKDPGKRYFYRKKALEEQWPISILDRQIKALYYERQLLWTPAQSNTKTTHAGLPIKDHYILEFLRIPQEAELLEKDLESSLLQQLEYFLLELGNGFSFVARQKMVTTSTGKHFFIDLVFYHFELKCFVLIDLKVGELSHRDIGQMDMYVRLYEDKWRKKEDNPTIGIILCSEKDQTIVKYSLLSDHRYLYASTYQLGAPAGSSPVG